MRARYLIIFLLTATVPVGAQLYQFDPIGSTVTYAKGINRSGAVTGFYMDSAAVAHGFVRDPQGNITPFDPSASTGTFAESINTGGSITGYYNDSGVFAHGFVRDGEGNITAFDAAPNVQTIASSINSNGAIAGSAGLDGFVRDPLGNITIFRPSGSNQVYSMSINSQGAITGFYADTSTVFHGFVRDAGGNITTFDPPGSIGTFPQSINTNGAITGYYDTAGTNGFVRDPQGNITSFGGVGPLSINSSGATVGYISSLGFIRDSPGNVTLFAVAGSTHTEPSSLNSSDAVTGTVLDPSSMQHGFVGRVPNTIDISKYTGTVSDTVWQNASQAGVSNVIVQAWGGGKANRLAQSQLLGAQANGLETSAYILLNYFSKDSAAFQVGQAIQAIGSALANLKFIALDVEVCCGEFTSWKPSTSYAINDAIMDPAKHIQIVTTAGTSGPAAPSWNDTGGTTPDGTGALEWKDTGAVVINQASRLARISAAVSDLQSYHLPHGVIIYTDGPKGNWQAITGSCGTGTTNNCSGLISLPLWDVEHKAFYAGDGLLHCGDGIAELTPFTPYSSTTWQSRSGNQYAWGFAKPANTLVAPSWDEYELGLAPAAKRACNGETNLFGLTGTSDLDLDYFDPALFR